MLIFLHDGCWLCVLRWRCRRHGWCIGGLLLMRTWLWICRWCGRRDWCGVQTTRCMCEADVSALFADEGSDWWSFPECLDDSSPLLKMRIQNPWWFWLARGGGVSVPLFGERERWRKLREVVMNWRDTESGTQLMEPPGTRCIMVAMLWCAANEDVKMSCVQRMQNGGDR